MDEKQYQALVEKVGKEAADKIAAEMKGYEQKMKEMTAGNLTEEKFKSYQQEIAASIEEVKSIAKAQGTSINALLEGMNSGEGVKAKTIAETLKSDNEELREIYKRGVGTKTYMVSVNSKGQFIMTPFDLTEKAAGPHASVADVGGNGNVASIAQALNGTTLLRMGTESVIMSQYRNSPWIFDLVNLVNANPNFPFALWYDEQARQGSPAQVAEGAAKPLVQYAYELKTSNYKKQAMLVSFTDEFSMDFGRLESDILGKARIDLVNSINSAILPNIISAATAYNTGASFIAGGNGIEDPNDFDVIAAMAAQAENATFKSSSNAAVVSTFKKYRMGITKDNQAGYVNPPDVIKPISIVGNPDMAADNVLVGDFKNYNVILRGGLIVKVGYNGTDFAENKFSTVLEQFYFDYISDARKPAIVKGTTFANVKSAIGNAS